MLHAGAGAQQENNMRNSINKLILEYEAYANRTLSLIASENIPSPAVRKAMSSLLIGKYAEGYASHRYYNGTVVVDKIENEVIELAKEVFNTNYHVNVQAYSGSIANLAIYSALLERGDTILSLKLTDGGHLSHGSKVSITSKLYNIVNYTVGQGGKINFNDLESLVKKSNPKLIVCGFTSYPYSVEFAKFGAIARKQNALLLADISHISAFVATGLHPSPFNHADVVMTTTHKSLAGPRAALIFSRSETIAEKINKAVFPFLQGGPHLQSIAACGIALNEAKKMAFRQYATGVLENAKVLHGELKKLGLEVSGCETHLLLLNTQNSFGFDGSKAADLLESIGIIVNKNSLPTDQSVSTPSGIRLGTPVVTRRGMGPTQMTQIAQIIANCLQDHTQSAKTNRDLLRNLTKQFPIT